MKAYALIAIGTMSLMIFTLTATASLVPTAFGFPVLFQNASTSAFNTDFSSAVDIQSVNVNFPSFGSNAAFGPTSTGSASTSFMSFGSVSSAFPSVSQNSMQLQTFGHTDFARTSHFTAFSYPFAGIGPTSIPGFGFGF